jgi:hypothetical protein
LHLWYDLVRTPTTTEGETDDGTTVTVTTEIDLLVLGTFDEDYHGVGSIFETERLDLKKIQPQRPEDRLNNAYFKIFDPREPERLIVFATVDIDIAD